MILSSSHDAKWSQCECVWLPARYKATITFSSASSRSFLPLFRFFLTLSLLIFRLKKKKSWFWFLSSSPPSFPLLFCYLSVVLLALMPTVAKNSSKFPQGSRLHQHMKSLFLSGPLSNSSIWYHQQLYERVFAVCKIIMSSLLKPFQNFWQKPLSSSPSSSNVFLLIDYTPIVWR